MKSLGKIAKPIAILTAAVLFALGVVIHASVAVAAEAVKTQSAIKADFKGFEGRWIRKDGGYILELKNVKKDGSVAAAYFNPRPIKVYEAKIARKNGDITLYVELRDINYPGSKYTLKYDPASDRLTGRYFQAVDKLTFDIEFVRAK